MSVGRLAQIRTAAVIARLRALDVPLAAVAELLVADDATVRARLAEHRQRLAARVDETRRVLDDLDRVTKGEEELVPETTTPELTVKEVPVRTYVALRERAPMEELTKIIPRLIAETHAWLSENGGFAGAPMAMVGPPGDDDIVELEVGWPVDTPVEPPPPFELATHEGTRAIVHRHVGPYERLHDTYAGLERAMAAAGLRPSGPATESYETNPEEEPDPQKWITEIVWPVE